MAAANRGKCCKSVSLCELLEWPMVDGVLLRIGLVLALNVIRLSVQKCQCLCWVQQGARLVLGSPFYGRVCFCVPLCQSLCPTGNSVKGHEGWDG